jgi:hypothetical protein
MSNGKKEPTPRDIFKRTLRGLAPDPVTGSKKPSPGTQADLVKPSRGALGRGSGLQRASLVSESDPDEIFEFFYNPSEWNDSDSAQWSGDNTSGRPRPKYAYKHGGERTLTFQILLDEVGLGQPYGRVYIALMWLRSRLSRFKKSKKPKRGKPKHERTGDILLLIRGRRHAFRCHIKDMRVREDFFEPITQFPLRAWVDLTLVQNLEDDDLLSFMDE